MAAAKKAAKKAAAKKPAEKPAAEKVDTPAAPEVWRFDQGYPKP